MQVNLEIRAREVRVIDPSGKQLGIMPLREALRVAQDAQLDLVRMKSNARPPVCKIMDYGKHKYEQSKREKEARRKQRVIEVKEIRMSPHIEEHDLQVRTRNAIRFLKAGDKLKVTIRFRGREITHAKLGEELLKEMAEAISDYGVVERKPRMEGRNMVMFVSPKDIIGKE